MQVILFSDAFGTEEFPFENDVEALVAFERLKKSCSKQRQRDGVERALFLVSDRWTTEGYDSDA